MQHRYLFPLGFVTLSRFLLWCTSKHSSIEARLVQAFEDTPADPSRRWFYGNP